eukprot:TRINITY_DN4527_c0_g1_i1.p1 TRINITY_DN4527_c0_g1~~TRINITY_DN4527_c0_g1_i1.p1  ORF type:complete len:211 (-),score=57.39 TRINITY_DN4527_c0_g1_i1:55-687(-)
MEDTEPQVLDSIEAASCVWVQYFDGDKPYYYNTQTEVTQWEVPAEYASFHGIQTEVVQQEQPAVVDFNSTGGWAEYFDEEAGAPHYYNHITGVSQWEMPPEIRVLKELTAANEVEEKESEQVAVDEFGWEQEEQVDPEETVSQIRAWVAEEECLQHLDTYFEEHSYVIGFVPGTYDYEFFSECQSLDLEKCKEYPHFNRWLRHISAIKQE